MKARRFTPEEEKAMLQMASVGMTFEQIAKAFECDPKTLVKRLGVKLHGAKQKAIGSVLGALYKNAIKGNVAAQIFIAKTQAGFREVEQSESTGPIQLQFVRGADRPSLIRTMNEQRGAGKKDGTSDS